MQSEVSFFLPPLVSVSLFTSLFIYISRVSPTLTKEWDLDRDFHGTERWVSRLIAGTEYWDVETNVTKTNFTDDIFISLRKKKL
jgi:hypothetical protein